MRRAITLAALGSAIVLLGFGAGAQQVSDQDVATRRGLIESALAARTAGEHQHALDLAERAGRIQMSASLRRFIAEEEQSLGQFAAALGTAELCVRDAERDVGSPNRDTHMAACRAMISDLATRVGRIVVHVPQPAPEGLHVSAGGRAISDAVWDVPFVVNPGDVVIEASAPGVRAFAVHVAVRAGTTSDVPIVLERVAESAITASTGPVASGTTSASAEPASVSPASTPASGALAADVPPPSRAAVAPPSSASAAPAIVSLGVGVLGIAASIVAGVVRNGAMDALTRAGCAGTVCPSEMQHATYDTAYAATVAVDVGLVVGLAGIALGGVLLLRLRHGGSERAGSHASIGVAPLADGLSVGVAWSM